MIKFLAILIMLFNSFAFCHESTETVHNFSNNFVHYSSLIDPEECYSASKAFLDVGIYPARQYKANGIKIGMIDQGIPQNLSDYSGRYYSYGSTISSHTTNVASVLAGSSGVACEATVYFASTSDYEVDQCMDWLMNVQHVDVINMSGGFNEAYNGLYSTLSGDLDNRIKNSGIPFVCAVGNNNLDYMNTAALAINALSIGSSNRNNVPSPINQTDMKDDFDTVIKKPNAYAPGYCLFGFDSQNLNVHDFYKSNTNYVYSGTSFSAPIVTGIIALLMEEYPGLRGKPEIVNCIIENATTNGIVNYQDARQIAKNYFSYTIETTAINGQLLFSIPVNIPYNESILINNYLLFNAESLQAPMYYSNYYDFSQIEFSKCRITIESFYNVVFGEVYGTYSNTFIEFVNEFNYEDYYIKVYLFGNKAPVGIEKASLSYRFGTRSSEMFSLSVSNYYLDAKPSFSWSVNYSFANGNVSLFIMNYKNQAIIQKHNLNSSGSYILTLSEWHSVLSLRGKEYYAFLRVTNINNKYYYSNYYIFNEPDTFEYLTNINPVDYGFASSYNNVAMNSSMTIDGVTIYIERLRCGYIEDQYINLSSKKHGHNHAYLQLTFDRIIKYLAFGVTLWRKDELTVIGGDTAVVEVMNSNGVWNEAIDLLYDVTLPKSRRDILRFDFTNILGIRFDITSITGGDGNKGRLCVDNISFTDDNNYTEYLSSYTEPIVVRSDFVAPNYDLEYPY